MSGITAPLHPSVMRDVTRSIALAVPLILTNIAPFLFSFIAMGFLGRQNTEDLASAGLAFGLFNIALGLLTGIDAAAMTLFSSVRGEKTKMLRRTQSLLQHSLIIAVIACLCLGIGGLWCKKFWLMTGQDPMIASRAEPCLFFLIVALFPYTIFKLLRALMGVYDRQVDSLYAVFAGIAVHVLCCWLFIAGPFGMPQWGVKGAGLATLIASLVMMLSSILTIINDKELRKFSLPLHGWRIEAKTMRMLIHLALPIAMTIFFEISVFYAALITIGRFGAIQLSAHALVLQIVAMTFKIPVGIGQAATILLARLAGAKDYEGVRRAGWVVYFIGLFYSSCTAMLLFFCPKLLISIFININDPQNSAIIYYATLFFIPAAFFQIFDGIQGITAGMLRGLKDAVIPMLIAGFGYWVLGLPTGIFLAYAFNLQGLGIWIGLATGLTVVAIILTLRWVYLLHKRLPS